MRRLGFRQYLFLVLSVLAALPVLGLSVWQTTRWSRFRAQQADEDGVRTAQSLARELGQLLESSALNVEALGRQIESRGTMDPDALRSMLAAQHRSAPRFLAMGVLDAEAQLLAVFPSTPQLPGRLRYADLPEFTALVQKRKTVITEPLVSRLNPVPVLGFAAPIQAPDGRLLGIVFGSLPVRQLEDWAEAIEQRDLQRKIYLFDRRGRAVVHPNAKSRGALKDLSAMAIFKPSDEPALRSGVDERGTEIHAAVVSTRRRDTEWTVAVTWDEAELRVQSALSRRGGLIATALALLAGLLAAIPLAGWLTQPLTRIVRVATAVGNGDLTQSLEGASWWEPREVQNIVSNFQTMLTQLRELLRSLRDSKDEMIRTVAVMSHMLHAQNGLLDKQRFHLRELSASAREVREMSAISSERAQEVMVRAATADTLRLAGKRSMEQSLQGLQDIRSQTNAIVSTIGTLLERTLEVGEIAERVKDLADQSNVVALNAAIQAMRAGEFGRGFETVAEQMRSLSNRSIESTVRIREILSNAEKAIRSTAATTEDGGRKIQHGMEAIQESESRLRELSAIVVGSNEGTKEIANAVQQQYSGIQEISRALDALDEAMDDTVLVFEQADKISGGLLAAAERISGRVDAFRVE